MEPVAAEVPINLDILQCRLGGPIELGPRHPLVGGVASPLVERIEVRIGQRRADIVAKRCWPAEPIAMRLIGRVSDTPAFPELIDSGVDENGPWLVMPFYPGETQSAYGEPPPVVYECLARLRATFESVELPPEIPRFDLDWCLRALTENTPADIRRLDDQSLTARALRLVNMWAESPLLARGFDLLPTTLLHGDVYGLNVRIGRNVRLIDWGSARVGPAMLDVALAAGPESAGLRAYAKAWPGQPLDQRTIDIGHAWGTMVNNGIFVGAVAKRLGTKLGAEMLDAGDAAYQRLTQLLN
jgi:hypothetical protein